MWDVGYIAGTVLFFAAMMAYVHGCASLGDTERAKERSS